MVWLLLGWLWLAAEPPTSFSALAADRFEVFRFENLESPTSLLFIRGEMYAGADLMEAHPGFYRIYPERAGFRTGLVRALPQQSVDGLILGGDGAVWVASGRKFGALEAEWVGQALFLEAVQYQHVETVILDLPNTCPDGTADCGLVGIYPVSADRWLAVTRRSPTMLHLLERQKDGWVKIHAAILRLDRKIPSVSEMKVIDGHLVFLLQDQWLLAGVDLSEAVENRSWKLALEPFFDFSGLKKEFTLENPRVVYQGLPEGFDLDPEGNLWVALNNRGFVFRSSPDGVLDNKPKLLLFRKEGPENAPPQ